MKSLSASLSLLLLARVSGLHVAPRRKYTSTSRPHIRNTIQFAAVSSRSYQEQALWDVAQRRIVRQSPQNAIELFFQSWNNRDLNSLVSQFADDCVFEDATYPGPCSGKEAVNRHFRILAGAATTSLIVVDDMVIAQDKSKGAVLYHVEQDGIIQPSSRHGAFFSLDPDSGLITSIFDTVEPLSKTGEANLAVLAFVSKLLAGGGEENKEPPVVVVDTAISPTASGFLDKLVQFAQMQPQMPKTNGGNAAQRYFEAWNRRDMDAAVAVFADNCQYDDTVFTNPLNGKDELKRHLDLCSNSLPSTFSFVIDDVADGGDRLGVQWHVENAGEQMPFTRGCSFYSIDKTTGLIQSGIDIVEPALLKMGGVKVFAKSLTEKLKSEPLRLVPLGVWVAYMYIVFLSDGILPGANALQLEQRTWEEVRDLSLNFFLVSPLLKLPFSPVVHPVLEGVFNLLLSWAALFAGFLSDERRQKPNVFPMLPAVAGMQFLTSAFLLPYLTLRTSEPVDSDSELVVCTDDQDIPAKIAENRFLGPVLGAVGAGAIAWGATARAVDFGGLDERMASFWQLMSIDRVGSSFLVDLAVFAVFQGWLVDDDLRRRGVADGELAILRGTAKYVPFFGLAAYMFLRPSLANRDPLA